MWISVASTSFAAFAKFPGPSAFIFSAKSYTSSALSTAVNAAQFIMYSGLFSFTKLINSSAFFMSNSYTSVNII